MPGHRPPSARSPRTGVVSAALGALLLVGLVATSCTASSDGEGSTTLPADRSTTRPPTTRPTTTARPTASPTLEPSACPDPATPTDHLTCSTLVLPEDRDRPDGRQVELPVIRFGRRDAPAPSGPALDPVVYLHGGPGEGAVDTWGTWSTLADGIDRELVVYDQRGGGAATPRLDCPEHDAAWRTVVADAAPWPEERAAMASAATTCAARLRDEGVDLDQYDTPTSTQDLEDLRLALGADTMTLVGVSYGSRLALDYLRTHPDHVSSLVLDGVDAPGTAGPQVDRDLPDAALTRLLGACAADVACTAAHPSLAAQLDTIVTRLDESPHVATIDGEQVRITGEEVVAAVFGSLYDGALIPAVPSIIGQLASGDTGVLDAILQRGGADLLGPSTAAFGAMASINCADLGAPDAAAERARLEAKDPGRAATIVLAGTDSFCSEWDVAPVDGEFLSPTTAPDDAFPDPPPTLVVTGELDPITPAAGARRVADALGATYLEVPRGGHAPLLADSCARAVLRSFLANAGAPDVSCTTTATPPPFA